jgi:hypothetical protein
MERLPHDPRNFREFVEADLRRAARLVIKIQDEIDPQLRIATPGGDYHLAVMLPSDPHVRRVKRVSFLPPTKAYRKVERRYRYRCNSLKIAMSRAVSSRRLPVFVRHMRERRFGGVAISIQRGDIEIAALENVRYVR